MAVGWQVLQGGGTSDIKPGAAVLPAGQSSGCRGCLSVPLPRHLLGVRMQPSDASPQGAAGEAALPSTIPLTISGPLPGAGIAAEALSMEARPAAGWEGAPAAPISWGRGPRSAQAPREGSPCHGVSSFPSIHACNYSKSLSAGAVRAAKIELSTRGGPFYHAPAPAQPCC